MFPGEDVHLQWTAPDDSTVMLTIDAGDVTCFLRLVLRGQVSGSGRWLATMDATPLRVERRDSAGLLVLEIADTGLVRRKFEWAAGSSVRVWLPPSAVAPTVTDWRVSLKSGRYDSQGRARGREIWWWVSMALLGVAMLAAAMSAIPRVEQATSAEIVEHALKGLIASVEGDSPSETRQLRKLLRKVLLHLAPVSEALASVLGKKAAMSARHRLFYKARDRMLSRLDPLVEDFQSARARLAR